jgi:hypothetical protein
MGGLQQRCFPHDKEHRLLPHLEAMYDCLFSNIDIIREEVYDVTAFEKHFLARKNSLLLLV